MFQLTTIIKTWIKNVLIVKKNVRVYVVNAVRIFIKHA